VLRALRIWTFLKAETMVNFRLKYEITFEMKSKTESSAKHEAFEMLGGLMENTDESRAVVSMHLVDSVDITELPEPSNAKQIAAALDIHLPVD